jgi:hypothetical protein
LDGAALFLGGALCSGVAAACTCAATAHCERSKIKIIPKQKKIKKEKRKIQIFFQVKLSVVVWRVDHAAQGEK